MRKVLARPWVGVRVCHVLLLCVTLRRLKTYQRATMTSEQESGLALMNIHYSRQIDIGATTDIFARKHPRRLLLPHILAE